MKRFVLPLTLLIALTMACSLSGLTGDEAATNDDSPPQSEERCGDNVCDGPENAENCPADCSLSEGSAARTPASSKSDTEMPPPWFAPDSTCQMRETSVRSEGSPWAFDSLGNTTELLSDGQVTCVLDIQVCGDTIFKQQVIGTDEDCPASLHFSYAPPTQVCCARWDEATLTGSPCDPLEDADCDGTINDADAYPLDFLQQ